MGVGLYDISDPSNPSWIDQLRPHGRILSVAVRNDLLAAAAQDGTVYLYDISDPAAPLLTGEISARDRVSRVAFRSGLLWILGLNINRAEVFDVTDPSSPAKLGEIDIGASDHFHARMLGTTLYTFHGNHLLGFAVRKVQ